jgi:RNA recognition motif-containing protein
MRVPDEGNSRKNVVHTELDIDSGVGFFSKISIHFLFFSEHYHIFVGDLSMDMEQQQLREAFQPFGEIS